MPSPTRINKARIAQISKLEREKENKDCKRKLRGAKTMHDRIQNTRLETVWERLSRTKLAAAGKRVPFLDNYKKNYPSPRHLPETHLNVPQKPKRPVVPNSGIVHRHSERHARNLEPHVAHNFYRPQANREGVVYLCQPLKEIIPARSIHQSSSGDFKNESKLTPKNSNHGFSSHELSIKFSEIMNGCPDDYSTSPLVSVRTEDSVCISAHISENFRGFLKKNQRSMDPDEISLVKNVLKMDERHRQLRKDDPELFKDIIKTQLNAILKQEKVLQTALQHLDGRAEDALASSPSPLPSGSQQIETTRGFTMVGQKISSSSCSTNQQVDVIFKNVPTLEKEIFILKALGDKLEATLKRSVPPKRHPPRKPIAAPKLKVQFNVRCAYEQNAKVEVIVKGFKSEIGFVREFIIAHKSLFELQEDASSSFYLPVNNGKNELKRTNFQKLKENPHILMSHIKPKNTLVPFNLMDQDPVFFNGYFSNHRSNEKRDVFSESSIKDSIVIGEGGDSTMDAHSHLPYEPLKIEEIPPACKSIFKRWKLNVECADLDIKKSTESKSPSDKQSESQFEKLIAKSCLGEPIDKKNKPDHLKEVKDKINTVLFEAPIRGKNRRRIRHGYTPMPPGKYYDPKYTITRTIAVGFVQVLLFVLLVMVFTYPDVKC